MACVTENMIAVTVGAPKWRNL